MWIFRGAVATLTVISIAAHGQHPAPDEHSPVISFEATTSIDDVSIGDGGFDYSVSGHRYIFSSLSQCGEKISSVSTSWAQEHKLPLLKLESARDRVFMQLSSVGLKGLIEIAYRYSRLPQRASVSVYLKKPSGETFDPEVNELTALNIPVLKENLMRALKCSDN